MNASDKFSVVNALQDPHLACPDSIRQEKQVLIDKIKTRGNLSYVTVEKQLNLLEELATFPLGRFLIKHKKFNGYYIHYVKMHALKKPKPTVDKKGKPFCPLENFILNDAPTSLATQERFMRSLTIIKKYLKRNCVCASIPCGLMGEFVELDLPPESTYFFHGIDLDLETLHQAKEYSKTKNLYNNCEFYQADAWNLNMKEKFDLIITDGLTIYEPNNSKIVQLYREFYKALQPQGLLLTSFLTFPPTPGITTEWELDQINKEALLLEKIIVIDILQSTWTSFRSTNRVKAQLQEAGFRILEIFYDKAHILPIILAAKI